MGNSSSKKKKKKKKEAARDVRGDLAKLDDVQLEEAWGTLVETDQSIARSLDLLFDTKRVGQHTLDTLVHQGDQIENVNHNLDTVRREEAEADRELQQFSFWKRVWRSITCRSNTAVEGPRTTLPPRPDRHQPRVDEAQPGPRESTDGMPVDALYQRTEDGLDRIDALTGDLQDMATSMNEEINWQNQALDQALDSADAALERVKNLTRRTRNTL